MASWKAHRPHQDLAPAFLQAFTTRSPHPASSQDDTRSTPVARRCTLSVPTTKNEVNTLPLGTIVQWITTEVVEPFRKILTPRPHPNLLKEKPRKRGSGHLEFLNSFSDDSHAHIIQSDSKRTSTLALITFWFQWLFYLHSPLDVKPECKSRLPLLSNSPSTHTS